MSVQRCERGGGQGAPGLGVERRQHRSVQLVEAADLLRAAHERGASLVHPARERGIRHRRRHPELQAEPSGDVVEEGCRARRRSQHQAVVVAAEEDRAALEVRAQLEPFDDGVVRRIRRRHQHGGGRQPAPHVARDAAREGGVTRPQRLQHAAAHERPRAGDAGALLEREPRHRDDRGDQPAPLLVEVAGGDGDHAAQMPGAAQRLQGERRVVDRERRARTRPASQHARDVLGQCRRRLGVERPGRMLADQHPRRVELPDPRVELSRQFGERRAQPVGPQRRQCDRALRLERPAAPCERLRGDGLGVHAGHGDERRAIRHLEQRHVRGAAGVDEQGRDAGTHDIRAESEPAHAGPAQPCDVGVDLSGVVAELRAGGQQHELLGEERCRVGQVGAVHPAHRLVECAGRQVALVDGQPQMQVAVRDQTAQGRGIHRSPCTSWRAVRVHCTRGRVTVRKRET